MPVNLLGLNREALTQFLEELGEKPFRARQLMKWIHQFGESDFNQMTDIVSTYGQILTPGSSTDTSRATAAGLVNQLAQGSTVQQVISGLDQQSQEKISGIQTNVGNIKSGSNVNPNNSLVGNTTTGPDGNQYLITD